MDNFSTNHSYQPFPVTKPVLPLKKQKRQRHYGIVFFFFVLLFIISMWTSNTCVSPYNPSLLHAIDVEKNIGTTTPIYNASNTQAYIRPEESTYLGFPEWYIVYSSVEYSNCINTNLPSSFPYFSSIGQFWKNYSHVYSITKGQYGFNVEDHVMLIVIGSSLTAEYAIKGVYEHTIGAITEFVGGGSNATEEDVYAGKVAKEYADFIPTYPWYEFSFRTALNGLWKGTPFWGAHPVRKWERKIFLSVEYIAKAAYSSLIKFASHGLFGVQSQITYMTIKKVPANIYKTEPYVRLLSSESEVDTMSVPRYQAFTELIPRLAKKGVDMISIEGNKKIFLTIIVPDLWKADVLDGNILFENPILTDPLKKREALEIPVSSLSALLRSFAKDGVIVEHIHDF